MDKDQGYPMFDMPGGFHVYYDSSSSIESSDYDAAVSMGVVVGNSCSATGGTTSGALTSIGTVVVTEAKHNATGGTTQYEDLHHMALNSVMKDFQVQKDALSEMETVLQKRETELASLHTELETHTKEHAAHQEQLYNEQQLAMQWNHSQLEEFQRQLEFELQSQMEKMSTSQAANLKAHVQEEVTRLRESLQAEKEREMAKLKQEVTQCREQELPVGWGLSGKIQEDVGNEGNGGSPGERQTSPVEGVCEDEEVKLEKESEPAVHQDFILAEVCHLFKEKLGITQDLDFITHHPAAAEDICAYEYEDGFGPD
ncbi:hypothetical protein EDD16DRAFT_1524993 [Pisolithus croceorrhizus]|nr:hypothetical protein EDD16DRAFT_1524993 [Pisolithus croceorrhizus]KAI6115700.1 hypothetical protein EV401DRAFT_1889403 [Pisolithus croceorrhizus]